MRRVVITGIGVVTPLGNNAESTFANLTRGISGIGIITRFDTTGFPCRIAGEVKNLLIEDFIPPKDALRLDPFIHYAIASAIMAVEDAGLRSSELNPAGVIIGSSRGGIMSIERSLEEYLLRGRALSAYLMSASTISMASSYIAMRLGIKGMTIGISTACASGTNAIGEAFRLIGQGEIDIAIAGGAEAPICRVAVGGYAGAGALSRRCDEPQKASRPFDKDRDGFVISEGAGVIILEELTHALERGARIYAEIIGYGRSSDAFHQTRPDSDGEAMAIKRAIDDAGVLPHEIGYINAHATSTPYGDKTEAEAIKKVFGRCVDDIPVSAFKSMLGHMLGASGAVETAMTAMAIYRGIIPPTINLDNPDPECRVNHVTSTMDREIKVAIKNSFGFGGVNAVLVLRHS
ncbi:MAG: beta-ketoacyl-ACP synthase II [Thermodesulfovibrionia bacterium]